MKLFILSLLSLTLVGCPFFPFGCNCDAGPAEPILLHINPEKIKDLRVKSIRATVKGLNGSKLNEDILNWNKHGGLKFKLKELTGNIYSIAQERGEYTYYTNKNNNREMYYFRFMIFNFGYPEDLKKELNIELKMYINDKAFSTKKISFTPYSRYHVNITIDNISITDADIKKWFEK